MEKNEIAAEKRQTVQPMPGKAAWLESSVNVFSCGGKSKCAAAHWKNPVAPAVPYRKAAAAPGGAGVNGKKARSDPPGRSETHIRLIDEIPHASGRDTAERI